MSNRKVLIFIPEFPVRTETFIKREIIRLIERENHEYKIFSLKEGKTEQELPQRVQDALVYGNLSVWDIFKGLSLLITNFVSVFNSLSKVGISGFYTFVKGLGYAYKFKKFDPDIIYVHFFSEFSSVALVASIILDVDFAVSAHARDVLEYPDMPKRKVQKAKFITVCNENAYNEVIRLSEQEDPANVKLVYHGLNPKDLQVKKEIKKAEPPLIFCVGRYVKKKGLSYLIEAADKLKQKGIKFNVLIAGGGPLEETLQERINELGLQNEVELIGSASFENIKRLYHRSSIFVLPSVNTEEGDADGIPNTLIEAAMLKIPIVTTDAGSILDFLDEEKANIVPQRDSVALADAIEDLLKHPNSAQALTEEAYKKAIEMFDIDNSVQKIERLLG